VLALHEIRTQLQKRGADQAPGTPGPHGDEEEIELQLKWPLGQSDAD